MARWVSKRTTRSARRFTLVALLGVLAVGVVGGYLAFAANTPPPAPTISAKPAASVNVTTASFTYTDAQTVTKFQCALDGASFVDCGTTLPSSKSYTGLSVGSHTFQVRAFVQQGSQTSSATSYSWVVDQTPPTVTSINRATGSPTNLATVSWAISFSEPVTGADATDFVLASTGLTGAGSISVSGSGASYTVSASSGTGNGSLGLNLSDNDSIVDAAGNKAGGTGTGTVASGGTGNGSFSGQVYTIDKTRPTLTSFTKAGATPTAAASVSWTLVFSKPVTGLTASNFTVSASGLTGTTAVTGVTGTGTTWTVTASTGTGSPSGSGTLNLNLANSTGISDAAGNTLNATLPQSGGSYTVDHLAPPVAFGTKPPDPNSVSTSNFTWSSTPAASDFDHYACSTENGAFGPTVHSADGSTQACSSPLSYIVGVTNNGQHQFDLRAYDHLGNFTQITWSWKVAAGSIQDFTISGSTDDNNAATDDKLYPNGPARAVYVKLHNPNSVTIYVTALSVSAPTDTTNGCNHTDLSFVPTSGAVNLATATSSPNAIVVPAGGDVTLPAQGVDAPTIKLNDNGHDQTTACANQTFSLTFTGSAHS